MKLFEEPIVEIVSFDVQDVVTTSETIPSAPDAVMFPPCA